MQNTIFMTRLCDYKPSDYLIDTVDMDVQLNPTATIVRTKLVMRPHPEGRQNAPLVLDGDELELLSISLNGAPLDPALFTCTPQTLILNSPPIQQFTFEQEFTLQIETKLNPQANTKLMGLYLSNDIYCTQCEAEGFRRITYFLDRPDIMSIYTVRLEASKKEAPVLLLNGNPVLSGDVQGTNRHFAVWHDPHPKPAYLFALVAGNLGAVSNTFTTQSGAHVNLNVYVEKGKEIQADYAMDALKRSMRWDETAFGREYDLEVFNIVAVPDFNMGAMENKGLNIFNDKYVLALPETATDQDYSNIEAIIAHEYFHNWTGNRITCRDWFQLCLKEGLTVFRDQEFSSDMRSRAVKRIEDVIDLRERQFSEDSGPLSHAVRPEAYAEINNFYTATIYEKGAELIRMLKILMGESPFKAGMDLYFTRHDGTAATIEDFIACFAEISGQDLSHFFVWYQQAGTPKLSVTRIYNEKTQSLQFDFRQSNVIKPVIIPVALALIDSTGKETQSRIFVLDKPQAFLTLEGVSPDQVPSILRGFSAPVLLETDLTSVDYTILATHDTDTFNRWQAIQNLSLAALTSGKNDAGPVIAAFENYLGSALEDSAFAALALKIPSCSEVARKIGRDVNPDAIHAARIGLQRQIGMALSKQLLQLHQHLAHESTFKPDAASAGRRALNSIVLSYVLAAQPDIAVPLLELQFADATNMSDRLSSLSLLCLQAGKIREKVLLEFEQSFSSNPLVLDKWFAVQAAIPETATLENIKTLMQHKNYSITNPNRVRAVLGTFAFGNFTQFNRMDGAGYQFLAVHILELDKINPQVSARLATAFRSWKMLEPVRRDLAEKSLEFMVKAQNLSIDLKDIVMRTLS